MASSPLLDPAARPVIAHRGASADAPENTLAAFTLAMQQGADALELDIHVSRDGVPVVVHDPTLDRTTDESGLVAELSHAQIQRADAGAKFTPDGGASFPWRGRGVRVPSLAEVLGAMPSMPLLIEIKTGEAQQAVLQVLRRHEATGRCVAASADHGALRSFEGGSVPVGASRRDITLFYVRAHVGILPARVGYRIFAVPERYRGLPVPTARFVRAAGKLGCPVHVWTVNQPDRAGRLWRRGVAGIITDRPAELLVERARMEKREEGS